MTTLQSASPPPPPTPPPAPVVPREQAARPEPPAALGRPLALVSISVTIVALLAGVFVADLAVLGRIRHERDQQTSFATLRSTLANATAPVNQVDERGHLLALGTPLAVIDIPQIGVREVIREGTTASVLASGPGHRRDTPMPGQAGTSILMGRQAAYGGPFGEIGALQKGNVFAVTTGQGRQVFRVLAVRRAGQVQPAPVAAGKSRITLITAAGRAWVPEGILRVDADLVGAARPSGARPLTVSSLPGPEKALGTDPSAWVAIVLLAQGLLLASVAVTWVRFRWGRWQTWLAGGPVLLALGVALSNQLAALLPNLI